MAGSRKWLFRLAALVLVPVFVLALAEGALRLIGYGYPSHFFRRARLQDRDVLIQNDQFGLRFFPPEMARTPPLVVMPASKKPGTYRIFLMGESAALGDPRPAYGAGRYLDVLLRERFPGVDFEVVCVAMTAINSHGILPIAEECAAHQGDLWVVYMGNNEMVGPFGPATVFGRQRSSLRLIRLTLALKTLRVGQLLDRLGQARRAKDAGPWGGLGMFGEQKVAPDDPRRETARRHFERNLADILDLAGRAGCPVVLSTIASNLRDCAPFASGHAAALAPTGTEEVEGWCREAATNAAAGRWDAALAMYQRAGSLDPGSAEVQFGLGQCHLALTHRTEAATAFGLARDLDALPFRAESALNRLIRDAAGHRGTGVRLVPVDEMAAAQAGDGVPGAETFFEHVHFNFAGNYRLARAWAEAIELELPAALTQQRRASWRSQAECERLLGLTDWNRAGVVTDVLRRIQGVPFSRQANHAAQLQHWQDALKALQTRLTPERATEARTVYRDALLRAPQDHRLYEGYAEFLEAVGSIDEATVQWEAVRTMLPHHFAAYVHAGRLLGRQRQWGPAEERLRTALRLEPRSGEAHLELARVLAGRGELEAAIAEFSEAQRWQPANALIYYHLADVLAKQEKRAAARDALARAVQIQPSFWEARYLLGVELAMDDRLDEARRQFEEVVRWRPDHARAHLNLGVALARQGHPAEARRHFEETLRLDPQNPKAQQFLRALSSAPSPVQP